MLHPCLFTRAERADLGRKTKERGLLTAYVYATRANEVSRCFPAHAYYACCAMIGAAAESILVTAGVAKLGEDGALKLYRGTGGRKALTDAVLKGCPNYVARDFRLHTDLIGLWRDQSAHAARLRLGRQKRLLTYAV